MAAYDSESSSDDDLDIQTDVTLGYATHEDTGDNISHLGGYATWLDSNIKPSQALARCKVCNGYMALLLQLQADLQQHFPEDERRLFIWCCRRKQCSRKSGSVRAFREVKKGKTTRKPQAKKDESATRSLAHNIGSQLFGGPTPSGGSGNSNPFSTSSTPQVGINPFSSPSSSQTNGTLFPDLAAIPPQPPTQSFADKLKISDTSASTSPSSPKPEDPTEPWPEESSFPTPYPSYNIDAESEYLEPTKPETLPSSSSRITELEDEPSSSTANSASEKDLYESPHDKTFSHFTKILSQNPEQILRYEFSGTPLLYSGTDPVASHFTIPHLNNANSKVKSAGPVKGIPSCQYCGSARVFEMQLCPYLIFELEKDDEEAMKIDGGNGMEWGTVIVGVCSKNCGVEGSIVFREEWIGVQWEEGSVELKARK